MPALIKPGREPIRQAFHPKPQAHGHEWVMWVGNVPDHATQNELWDFFRNPQALAYYLQSRKSGAAAPDQPAANAEPVLVDGELSDPKDGGVSSVFLIKSSNCAFVNFETEAALSRAMKVFNGVPLRPWDPECMPLLCRIRRKDDDLRTGVAAQRGWGLHTNWIRLQAEAMKKSGLVPASPESPTEQRRKGKEVVRSTVKEDAEADDAPESSKAATELAEDLGSPQIVVPAHLRSHDDPPTSPSTHLGPSSNSDPSPPVKYGPRPGPNTRQSSSTSSGSFASTNSSFLARYFPKRYFILKSLSEVGDI